MKKISSVVTNYDSASPGFSEGKLRDNPGDDTGSSVVAAIDNDAYYSRLAVINKYRTGGITDAAESETNSDFLDGIEEAIGYKVDSVSAWSAATTYSTAGVSVMRYGMQFVNINATGNLNKDPISEPLYWLAVPDARTLFQDFTHGRVIGGGSHVLHDYNNAGYRQFFGLGHHKLGGSYEFDAYGVHLDGTSVGASTLSDIVETWFLKAVWAPGTTGSRTLVNAKGALLRAIDQTGGMADAMAERLEDALQGHWHGFAATNSTTYSAGGAGFVGSGTTGTFGNNPVKEPASDGTHGTPRVDSWTRDKSVTVGIPYVVIIVPA